MQITRLNTVLFEDFEDLFNYLRIADEVLKSEKDKYFYEHLISSNPLGWLLTVEIYSKETMKPITFYGKDNREE